MIVSIYGLDSLAYYLSLQSVSLLTLYRVQMPGSGISPAFTSALASLGLLHFNIISKSLVSFHTQTYKHMHTNLPSL